ncbi:MAG: tetraacyldisaccharide 4'-kinase [Parachlamydiaceae bacterium]|nr:tetraacyldisaccharide 4'-kinase [Parachlamydiaceae bacterium]
MLNKVEIYIRDVIRGRRKGWLPCIIKVFLLPLSWLYQFGVRWRNWAYDKGWMRRYVPPVPLVISIGNIVAGGTGKTPVTLLFAKAFYDKFPIAILSRGYRSKAEKLGSPMILCEGNGPLYSAAECGDEPYIFAQRLPKSFVIVGGNRQKASCLASKAGAEIILLDDGMQHRRLARDFDVVVVDVGDPFGQDYFLPRGFLREDKSSLSRADLIVLNHIVNTELFQTLKTRIGAYTKAPMVGTNWQVESVNDMQGNPIGSIKGKKVGMFCGIASPEYFRITLEKEGAIVVSEFCVADHEKPSHEELEIFADMCQKEGAEILLCTEKDHVKLEKQLSVSIPVAWLKMEMKVVEGLDIWQDFLKKAEAKIC